jgi:hypothetical protein
LTALCLFSLNPVVHYHKTKIGRQIEAKPVIAGHFETRFTADGSPGLVILGF